MASEVRKFVNTTTTRTWRWIENWGPMISDKTEWSVQTSGNNIILRGGKTDITMSTGVAKNVIQALTEALEGGE